MGSNQTNINMNAKMICAVACAGAMFLSSCSSIYIAVTDNPVGTKEGSVTGLKDATLSNAAKDGGITKIGTVKYQFKGVKSTITVTGT